MPVCTRAQTHVVRPHPSSLRNGTSSADSAKLRVEKSGRGGKTVTVVYDLPCDQAFLRDLAGKLKRVCGTGGTVVDNTVELQGDVRDRVRPRLAKKGWTIRDSGFYFAF